jgi:hypothetical protein
LLFSPRNTLVEPDCDVDTRSCGGNRCGCTRSPGPHRLAAVQLSVATLAALQDALIMRWRLGRADDSRFLNGAADEPASLGAISFRLVGDQAVRNPLREAQREPPRKLTASKIGVRVVSR